MDTCSNHVQETVKVQTLVIRLKVFTNTEREIKRSLSASETRLIEQNDITAEWELEGKPHIYSQALLFWLVKVDLCL